MKLLSLTLIAGALGAAAMAPAQAQNISDPGLYAAIGYYNVTPKSNNGVLAGAFKSRIDSDSAPAVTLGYKFNGNWAAEAWYPATKFQHDVKLNGAKSASIEHAPFMLTAQYHFLPNGPVQPFIGAGYGWVKVNGERTTGPIAGTNLNVKNADGFVGQVGLDYYATANVFIRADARYMDWQSKVELNGAGIGQAKVDPWIYGLSVGYRF